METIKYDLFLLLRKLGYNGVFSGNLYTKNPDIDATGIVEPLDFFDKTDTRLLVAVPTYWQVVYWLWIVKNIKISFSQGGYKDSVHVFISTPDCSSYVYDKRAKNEIYEFNNLEDAIKASVELVLTNNIIKNKGYIIY